MSTNTQLQKIAPPKIRRLRHRRRLVAGSPRVQGRHPALDNFLTREATRANAIVGIVGVTGPEILSAIRGVGTGVTNRNILDTIDNFVTAQSVQAARIILNYTNKGIPII